MLPLSLSTLSGWRNLVFSTTLHVLGEVEVKHTRHTDDTQTRWCSLSLGSLAGGVVDSRRGCLGGGLEVRATHRRHVGALFLSASAVCGWRNLEGCVLGEVEVTHRRRVGAHRESSDLETQGPSPAFLFFLVRVWGLGGGYRTSSYHWTSPPKS